MVLLLAQQQNCFRLLCCVFKWKCDLKSGCIREQELKSDILLTILPKNLKIQYAFYLLNDFGRVKWGFCG